MIRLRKFSILKKPKNDYHEFTLKHEHVRLEKYFDLEKYLDKNSTSAVFIKKI
jgi:hypothetical protein